jgi:hypothetical protein
MVTWFREKQTKKNYNHYTTGEAIIYQFYENVCFISLSLSMSY